MWCDNCCLILPLRAGAIAWAVFVVLYSAAGGLFLFMRGQYLFFVYPEWELYGGVAAAVAGVAGVSAVALSNRSYIWTRATKFLWPFLIVLTAIRDILMLVELQRGQYNIAWECANGGQLWTASAAAGITNTATLPAAFCTAGFSSLYAAFIVGMGIDLVAQIYMFFLMWRFSKRLEHYSSMKGPFYGGYYNA